jgi:hypothetical protein
MPKFILIFITFITILAHGANKKASHDQVFKNGTDEDICLGQGDPQNSFYINDIRQKVAKVESIQKQIDEKQFQIDLLNRQIANSLDNSDQTQKILADQRARAGFTPQKEKEYQSWKKSELQDILRRGYQQDVVNQRKLDLDKESKPIVEDIKVNDKKRKASGTVGNIDFLQREIDNLELSRKTLLTKKSKYRFIEQWVRERGQKTKSSGVCIDCLFSNPPSNIEQLGAELKKILVPHLSKDCVVKSLTAKSTDNTQRLCENTVDNKNRKSKGNQCINDELADFIEWNLNKAIDCLSSPGAPVDPNLLFMKVNNESTFRFFFDYVGGHGLMQTTQDSQDEMLGIVDKTRPLGRRFLTRLMNKHSKSCEDFKPIINYDKEYGIDEQSEFVKDIKSLRSSAVQKSLNLPEVKEITTEFEDRLNQMENDHPEIATLINKIDAANDLIIKSKKSNDISPAKRLDAEQAILEYKQQIDELAKKNDISKEDIDKLQTTKKFVKGLNGSGGFTQEEDVALDATIDSEVNKLNDMKKAYPKLNQKLYDDSDNRQCQFISLEEGIQRNILNGIGLYLYYRDGYYNGEKRDGSARYLLRDKFGIANPPLPLLNSVALAMYGRDGNGGAAKKITDNKKVFADKVAQEQYDAAVGSAVKYYKDSLKSKGQVEKFFNLKDLECSAK